MKSLTGVSCALWFVVGSLTLSAQQTFRVAADLVYVDVTVLHDDRPVQDLASGAFQVLDNGVRQHAELVTSLEAALDITLLLDASDSITHRVSGPRHTLEQPPGAAWIAEAATAVADMLRPGDRVRPISVATRITPLGPAPDGTISLDPGPSGRMARRTTLFDAIVTLAVEPSPPDRRQIVVALTDGVDTASIVDYETRSRVLDRSGAVVYIIAGGSLRFVLSSLRPDDLDPRVQLRRAETGRANFQPDPARPWDLENWRSPPFGGYEWILEDMTRRTGGRLYLSDSSRDFVDALRGALELARTRYLLAYQPREIGQPGWHDLDVSIPEHDEYEVIARRGYFR
jgi:hypothetical protein